MSGIRLEDCAIHFAFSFSIISLWAGRIVPLVWKKLQDISHPCRTLLVCLWLKLLVQIPRMSEFDPFCHWGRSDVIHRKLETPPVERVPLPERSRQHSSVACSQAAPRLALLGLTKGPSSSLPLTVAKSRCLQENTETERSRQHCFPVSRDVLRRAFWAGFLTVTLPTHLHLTRVAGRLTSRQRRIHAPLYAPVSSNMFPWDTHAEEEREVVADVHYCPVEEKVENHKRTDVQWKGVGDLEISYRGQR